MHAPNPTPGPGRNRNPASLLCDLRAQRTPLNNFPLGPCGETGLRLSFRRMVVSSLPAREWHAWGPGGLDRPCLWRAGGGVALSLRHQPGMALLPPCGCPGPSAREHQEAPVPGSVQGPQCPGASGGPSARERQEAQCPGASRAAQAAECVMPVLAMRCPRSRVADGAPLSWGLGG